MFPLCFALVHKLAPPFDALCLRCVSMGPCKVHAGCDVLALPPDLHLCLACVSRAAVSLPCRCFGFAMPSPCFCRVLPWSCRVVAVILLFMPCVAVFLPCLCCVFAVSLPRRCRVLPCSCRVVAVVLLIHAVSLLQYICTAPALCHVPTVPANARAGPRSCLALLRCCRAVRDRTGSAFQLWCAMLLPVSMQCASRGEPYF
jgi:hypothetical protein